MSAFNRAVKKSAKLRLALAGPSGSGKTWTSLAIAAALANGQPVAVVDTERGSASKYADLFSFDVLELDSFHPQKYVDAITEAAQAGYAVVVLDSLSHAWNGRGGILEIVQRKGNNFQAWGEVKPIENALIDAITNAPLHVIATMRSKTEYVVETNDRGKSAPRKVGTAPVQRDGMEYEFDIFGELDQENTLTVNKSRCPALAGVVIPKPGAQMAATLAAWLSGDAPANDPPTQATPAARATGKPAPATQPAQAGEPPWVELRSRIRAVGMTDRRDVDKLCRQVGVAGGWDEASTWGHYRAIDKRITALETAKANAEANINPPAQPAENDATAEDFPPDDTNVSDVPGAHDMRELPVPAVRS